MLTADNVKCGSSLHLRCIYQETADPVTPQNKIQVTHVTVTVISAANRWSLYETWDFHGGEDLCRGL